MALDKAKENEIEDDLDEDLEDAVDVDVESDDVEVELEVEDDTPPADKNRQPLPKEVVKDLDEDDLTEYSEKVKTRISQARKAYHDERRAKEAADRERMAAVQYAEKANKEVARLRATLKSGEKVYVSTVKSATEQELNSAKAAYKDAYDSGDADKMIEAQQRMNAAQFKLTQIENYRPEPDTPLQTEENNVQSQQQTQPRVTVDEKAKKWQEKNPWFGSDRTMSALAFGVHEELVSEGVDPRTDEYYRRIDSTMRKRFPEYEWGDTPNGTNVQRTKKTNVVAPVTRSTAPKKVRLTTSQINLAKRLGITPEQYALEIVKLEKANG